MASSSSSNLASQDNRLLPIIPCPLCGNRVLTDISKGGTRPGTRYYKCINYGAGGCSFFRWKEGYAELLQAGGVHGALHGVVAQPGVAPPAVLQPQPPQNYQDLARANLLVSVTNTMATLIVLAVLIAVLLGLVAR